MALQAGIAAKTRVRRRCQRCNSDIATVTPNGPHLAATCATCGVFIYNAPRHEFGLATRPVSENRKEIRPKRRAAILARDNGRCVLCGRAAADGVALTIGHLLSVDEGVALGADRDLLNDDLNLAAMCDTCQLGLGRQSVPVVVYLGLLLLYAERARRDGQPLEQIDITVPSYKAGRPTGGA